MDSRPTVNSQLIKNNCFFTLRLFIEPFKEYSNLIGTSKVISRLFATLVKTVIFLVNRPVYYNFN